MFLNVNEYLRNYLFFFFLYSIYQNEQVCINKQDSQKRLGITRILNFQHELNLVGLKRLVHHIEWQCKKKLMLTQFMQKIKGVRGVSPYLENGGNGGCQKM